MQFYNNYFMNRTFDPGIITYKYITFPEVFEDYQNKINLEMSVT